MLSIDKENLAFRIERFNKVFSDWISRKVMYGLVD